MSDTHKFKSVTKSFTWHTKYANAHNVIPIIRSRVYCVVSTAKPLMQPKTLVRKYQTILRFILDLLKLGKSLEKISSVPFIFHMSYKINNPYESAQNLFKCSEYWVFFVLSRGKIFPNVGLYHCYTMTFWHLSFIERIVR